MGSLIENFFSGAAAEFQRELQALEQQVPLARHPGDDAYLSRLYAACRDSVNACRRLEASLNGDAGALQNVRARFRAAIASWFDQSWFMQRARAKPRGYPGDFEIMEAIYDGAPRSGGLGGYLDLYFLGTTLARGVRARREALEAFLASEARSRNGRLHVLNVGEAAASCWLGAAFSTYRSRMRAATTRPNTSGTWTGISSSAPRRTAAGCWKRRAGTSAASRAGETRLG